MARHEEETFGKIRLEGIKTYFGGNAATVIVYTLIEDAVGDILWCTGETKPTDDLAGFAKGCIFIDTNVDNETSGTYVNIGTNLLAEFSLVTSAAAD